MTGTVYRGMFNIAGGDSYVAQLISDAGGEYVWADDKASGGTSVDMETQIARASNADVWINGGDWKSLKAMLAEEAALQTVQTVPARKRLALQPYGESRTEHMITGRGELPGLI